MNRHLKTLSVAFALAMGSFGLPSVGDAQGPGATEAPASQRAERGQRRGHRGHGHRGGDRALAELTLTPNQQAQIDAIRASARERMQELREAGRTDASREARRAIFQETRGLIQDVLTDAQKAELATKREARHTEHRARRLTRMTERLSLTPAQVQRIERIMEESATARQGAQRNADSRAAMEAVRDRTQSAIRNVLTPAQRTQMEAMHSERGECGMRGERGEGERGQGRRGHGHGRGQAQGANAQ